VQQVLLNPFHSVVFCLFDLSINRPNLFVLIFLWCSFDELLELSQKGDNSQLDMLVGDIYGGLDYSKVL
jgi:Fumble